MEKQSDMLRGAGIFTYITGWYLGQMLVNIPYMEHMGIKITETHVCLSWLLVPFWWNQLYNTRATNKKQIYAHPINIPSIVPLCHRGYRLVPIESPCIICSIKPTCFSSKISFFLLTTPSSTTFWRSKDLLVSRPSHPRSQYETDLVGGFNLHTPLKNMTSSIEILTFPIYGNIEFMFQTTNQWLSMTWMIWVTQNDFGVISGTGWYESSPRDAGRLGVRTTLHRSARLPGGGDLRMWSMNVIPGWWFGTCFYFSIYWE